jgi:gliding motility-associated protein GldM
MAGGNLSPRQKMINMMYLVLTALLAMNVSAEILEAFASLRASLKSSADSFSEKNLDTKKGIIGKIQEEVGQGNKKNEKYMALMEVIEKKTNETVGYLEGVIKKLEVIGEKNPVTGDIEQKKETERNYQLWMGAGTDDANGGRGAGEAMKLKDMLNGYVSWANKLIADNDSSKEVRKEFSFKDIAIEPSLDPNVPASSENKNKKWEYFTWHSKPVIADLAMMEKFKLDIQDVHSQLLTYVKTKLGAVTFKIDSLIAVDAPMSRVVAAGMKFETKLFVAMSSKEIKPEFIGSGITTDPGGNSATMTFTAPGGFAKGQTEKEAGYHAVIKVPRTDGTFQELKVEGKYTIRKPEVVITSASVQNLYANCGNIINVDVPALGEFYNPKFAASSATVLPSTSDKRKVTIVPTGKTCVLSVSSLTNGQNIKIDDITYKVIRPPRPTLDLMVNGKLFNGATPIPAKAPCKIVVNPDNDFKSALPKDARYMVSNIKLLSQRSLGAPTTAASFSGAGKDAVAGINCDLGNALKGDGPGTKIFFNVEKVYRINFQNQKIEEPFSDKDLYIGAIIK